jgi:hypothetical protein
VTPSDTLHVTNASGDNAHCCAKSLYVGVSGNLATATPALERR